MFNFFGWVFDLYTQQLKRQTYSRVSISFDDSFEGVLRNQTLELQMEFLVSQIYKNHVLRMARQRWKRIKDD